MVVNTQSGRIPKEISALRQQKGRGAPVASRSHVTSRCIAELSNTRTFLSQSRAVLLDGNRSPLLRGERLLCPPHVA